MRKIANWVVTEMGDAWAPDSCWLSNKGQLQITAASGPHSNDVYASITVTRLVAFFSNPTLQNWGFLTSNTPTESPFDHRCHRGHQRYDGQIGCLNGMFHGGFSTKEVNEGRKACKGRTRCLCPGHGPDNLKCLYTHETGEIQPCRMVEDHLPRCGCEKKCF